MARWRTSLGLLLPLLAAWLTGCGGGADLLLPTQAPAEAHVHGLLREHPVGELVEHEDAHFRALFDAETVRAPEWSVSSGDLRPNGQSMRWRLPEAGRHTITLTIYLVDGRTAEASWTVDVKPR